MCHFVCPEWQVRPNNPNPLLIKVISNTFASSHPRCIDSEATYQRRQQKQPSVRVPLMKKPPRTSEKQTVQNREDMKNGAAVIKSQSSTLLLAKARVKATKGQSGLRLGWQLSVVSRQSARCEQTHRSRAVYWHGMISYLRAFQCRCAIKSRDGD